MNRYYQGKDVAEISVMRCYSSMRYDDNVDLGNRIGEIMGVVRVNMCFEDKANSICC